MDWDFSPITCFLLFLLFVLLWPYYVYNAFVLSFGEECWWPLVLFPILYLRGMVFLGDLSIVIYLFMIR